MKGERKRKKSIERRKEEGGVGSLLLENKSLQIIQIEILPGV